MESRRVGNRLNVFSRFEIVIVPGDCRKLALKQVRHRLWENKVRVEIRIVRVASISRPPTGIQRELCQVRESRFPAGSVSRATRQRSKRVKIGGVGAL
jgi:hypothetical protein